MPEFFCTYTHIFLYIILVKFSFFFSVVTGVPSLLYTGEGSGSAQPPHEYAHI